MTEPAAAPPPSGQGRRMLTDIGPLLAFFAVNYIWGLMAGTAVLVVATVAALCLAYLWERRLALMPAVGCLFVVIFGGLTLAFDDAFFIKIKPTVVNVMLAAALAIGLALGRLWLRHIMGAFIQVSDTGWRHLTWAWIGFSWLWRRPMKSSGAISPPTNGSPSRPLEFPSRRWFSVSR